MPADDEDPFDFVGSASCPGCLTLMTDNALEDDGRDAHWRCPSCGLVSLAG